MSSKPSIFSKSLRNIRRHFGKRNGRPSKKTSELIISGTKLISKNMYDASSSPETFAFLSDLVENDITDRAKNLIDLIIDLHPRQVAKNPKFGETLKKLMGAGEEEYVIALMDKLISGKIDSGPSLPTMAAELAGNESVLSALKELAKQGEGAQVALLVHRLAIIAPKELSKNSKLNKTLDVLAELGFRDEINLFSEMIASKGSGILR